MADDISLRGASWVDGGWSRRERPVGRLSVQLLLQRVKGGDGGLYQQCNTPVIIVRRAVKGRAMVRARGDCRSRRPRRFVGCLGSFLAVVNRDADKGTRPGRRGLAAARFLRDAKARAMGAETRLGSRGEARDGQQDRQWRPTGLEEMAEVVLSVEDGWAAVAVSSNFLFATLARPWAEKGKAVDRLGISASCSCHDRERIYAAEQDCYTTTQMVLCWMYFRTNSVRSALTL